LTNSFLIPKVKSPNNSTLNLNDFLSLGTNPFGTTPSRTPNPFTNTSKAPTLEQLTTSNNPTFNSGSTLPPPLIPSSYNNNMNTVSSFNTNNPFM
jgi:hypothetical protein